MLAQMVSKGAHSPLNSSRLGDVAKKTLVFSTGRTSRRDSSVEVDTKS
jgi:hypothetical protein